MLRLNPDLTEGNPSTVKLHLKKPVEKSDLVPKGPKRGLFGMQRRKDSCQCVPFDQETLSAKGPSSLKATH